MKRTKIIRRNKTKRNKKISVKKYKKNYRKTRKLIGAGEKEQRERKLKDDFRNMFMKAFKKLEDAVKSGDSKKLQDATESFKNGFKSNQISINTLIPVTTNTVPVYKYKYNSSETPIIAFVPSLVVIFDNIDDFMTRKALITSFIKNKGNINLKSYTKDITALSDAIRLQDKELVKFLLESGADIKGLTDEQKTILDNLIKEEEIEEIIEPEPSKPIVKLEIPTELPSESGYNPTVEPDFWKPIFGDSEMLTIRKKLNDMMNSDGGIPIVNKEVSELWSVCKINQSMIPTYFTQMKNEPYELFGTLFSDQDVDFSHYNIVLCAALIVFGIISKKMIGQDYKLIFKGGKAIQLELAGTPETATYKTEDIDVLIMPDTDIPYEELKVKNLSGHIAYLLRWFLNTPETQYAVSVQAPNPANTRANPFIFKLSYVKVTKKYDFRRNAMVDDFKQFSDIDFKEIPQTIKSFFEKSKEYSFYISELDENVLFRCPNIGALLDEKIYYYSKYTEFKQMLQERKPITEQGYEKLNVIECDRFLEKFKRAILAMNKGLQKQRNEGILPDELLIKEINSIMNRLDKLGFKDPTFKDKIIQSLYQ
jgi:hypothetical protein